MELEWRPQAVVAAVVVALWIVALMLQLSDIASARFDTRRLARGTRSVVRLHPVAWTMPFAAVVVVVAGVGADVAAHRLFERESPLVALLTALVTATLLVVGWLVVAGAVTRPAADSYRVLRDELVDLHGVRVHQDVLDELRERLSAIEGSGTPAVTVDESPRSAVRWVFRRPRRLVPPVLALLALIALAIASAPAWLVTLAVAAVLVSVGLAVAGAHTSLLLLARVRVTQDGYRAEALQLLADAEKTSRKRVQGLGDRVTRALQILREQQD